MQGFEQHAAQGPRTVSVGFRVTNMSDIDPIAGTMEVTFTLFAQWIDQSLIGSLSAILLNVFLI